MTDFNHNDIIEYIDDTLDENFEEAKKWAKEHNTTLEELVERRIVRDGSLYRYFQIGCDFRASEPTEEQIKAQRIA